MQGKQDFYSVANYGDKLNPGTSLKIEHHISFHEEKADISELVALPLSELERRRAYSVKSENAEFVQIQAAVGKWEEQAAATLLLDKAIEYCKIPVCEHTGNQWQKDEYGNHISNMTYKMSWHVFEHTRYDREKGASVPASWDLTWGVHTNRKIHGNSYISNVKIAGQDRKRFTDKAAMEKYLHGRIAAYSHLFKELSPPVPQEYAKCFKINGQLLPGYTIVGDSAVQAESTNPAYTQPEDGKTSVLGKIAEARETQGRAKTAGHDSAEPGKRKTKETEL